MLVVCDLNHRAGATIHALVDAVRHHVPELLSFQGQEDIFLQTARAWDICARGGGVTVVKCPARGRCSWFHPSWRCTDLLQWCCLSSSGPCLGLRWCWCRHSWNFKFVIWNTKFQIWHLKYEISNLSFEIWNFKFVIWNMKFQISVLLHAMIL